MLKRLRRQAFAACAAGVLLSSSIASAYADEAATTEAAAPTESVEGNLVAIGDSITADPAVNEWFPYWIGMDTPQTAASPVGCPTSPTTYAKLAGERLGLRVDDYSCTGLSIANPSTPHMSDNVNQAIEDGVLNPSTERVILTVGFNDTYAKSDDGDEGKLNRFVEQGSDLVNRIREAAPNARIQLVGYPTISTNGGDICPVQVIDDRLFPTPPVHLPIVDRYENLAQNMDRSLAEQTGIEFLDMKPSTAEAGMCADDSVREYAGIIDTTGPQYHLPFHVNARGHRHIADEIVNS